MICELLLSKLDLVFGIPIECSLPQAKRGELSGGLIIRGGEGAEFSEGQGELNSQRRLDSRGLPCFSANVLFLWQHCY